MIFTIFIDDDDPEGVCDGFTATHDPEVRDIFHLPDDVDMVN